MIKDTNGGSGEMVYTLNMTKRLVASFLSALFGTAIVYFIVMLALNR